MEPLFLVFDFLLFPFFEFLEVEVDDPDNSELSEYSSSSSSSMKLTRDPSESFSRYWSSFSVLVRRACLKRPGYERSL